MEDKSIVMTKPWVICRKLSIQEREMLFLYCEAAGLLIYPSTRMNTNIERFPYIGYAASKYVRDKRIKIAGFAEAKHGTRPEYGCQIHSYEYIMELLRQEIEHQAQTKNEKYDRIVKGSESL